MYRLLKIIEDGNYLPSSIFFFKAARPPISPKVVFSASADFFAATLIFFLSCTLKIEV